MAAEGAGAADDDQGYVLVEAHDVTLGNEGGEDHNTIVLGGIDLVVPVELDLDGDPLQDDEVNLRSEHGHYNRTLLSSDHDVTPAQDSRFLYYRFRHVWPGAYRLSVRIAGQWTSLLRGIVITKDGAFVGGKKLEDALPTDKAAEPEERTEEEAAPEPRPSSDVCEH
jgi:hypothetical protein